MDLCGPWYVDRSIQYYAPACSKELDFICHLFARNVTLLPFMTGMAVSISTIFLKDLTGHSLCFDWPVSQQEFSVGRSHDSCIIKWLTLCPLSKLHNFVQGSNTCCHMGLHYFHLRQCFPLAYDKECEVGLNCWLTATSESLHHW